MVDESAIRGEPNTGYENEKGLGEFECENCKFFHRSPDPKYGGCWEKNMMKYSRQPRLKDGHVKVEAEGCCEYVVRVGNPDLVHSRRELKDKYWGKKVA